MSTNENPDSDATDDDRETYVHEPGAVDGSALSEPGTTHPRNSPDQVDVDTEFDWRGWALVGMVLFAFLVVPLAIYYLPTAGAIVAGVDARTAYLALPLLPAILLGVVAVWSAVRSRLG